MDNKNISSKDSELKSVSREIEGYKVQVRGFDITRKINFFLTAACIFGIFYDKTVNQWWLNQYIIAGIIFGFISFFSHKKWEKTSRYMAERESDVNHLRHKNGQSKVDGD